MAGDSGHHGGFGARDPGGDGEGRRILSLVDYDGTMTTRECNEIALQHFVGDAWRALEAEAQADRMSHAQCFDLQVRMIRAPRREFLGLLTAVAEPAPGLAAFFAALAERGGRAVVVSAGLREAIEGFWRRESLPELELFASELVGSGPDGGPPYRLAFSEAFGDCPRCGPRSCKSTVLRALRRPGDLAIVFGDGASDLCPAREADLTFARAHLAERCAAEGLDWRPLADFSTVMAEIDGWLESRGAPADARAHGEPPQPAPGL